MIDINKIKPSELAFDIDEVVADFLPVFFKVLKEDTGIIMFSKDIIDFALSTVPLPKRQIRKIVYKAASNPFLYGMKMIPGAKDVLLRLLEYGPVTFVTARKNGKLIKEWIENELGTSGIIVLAMNGHDTKAEALKKRDIKYFIDDRIETCYQMYSEGIIPIVFNQNHNQEDCPFIRVNNWDQISNLIDW